MSKSNTPKDEPHTDPPSANEEVAKLRLHLCHFSLLELEEEGLISWDRDRHIVMKGPQFDEKRPEWRID